MMNWLDEVALVLLIIGGLNWGLVGLFNVDVVLAIFGGIPILASLVYVIIGLSALYVAYFTYREATGRPMETRRRAAG